MGSVEQESIGNHSDMDSLSKKIDPPIPWAWEKKQY
jgi:hypothetical protein